MAKLDVSEAMAQYIATAKPLGIVDEIVETRNGISILFHPAPGVTAEEIQKYAEASWNYINQ
jgi:hypothetical protein